MKFGPWLSGFVYDTQPLCRHWCSKSTINEVHRIRSTYLHTCKYVRVKTVLGGYLPTPPPTPMTSQMLKEQRQLC